MSDPGSDEFVDLSNPDAPVRGYLRRCSVAKADCLILTHGAGANCQSPLLTTLAEAFHATGLTVLRCDLPFRQSRPHGPPPRGSAESDQEGLRAAVGAMRQLGPGRVILGGHSYGGRQASMLAASAPHLVEGLLLLSYPLHPPERPTELRTKHFSALQTPALFVSGTRDGFATITEIESALTQIPGRTELLAIPGAGHELIPRRNRDEFSAQVVSRFFSFLNTIA